MNKIVQLRLWSTLLVLTTIALCLVGLPTVYTDPFPQSVLSIVFFSLFYIGQYFLYALLLYIIFLPIFLLIKSDKIKLLSIFLPLAGTLIFFAMNAKVYAFWRAHINGSVIRMYFAKGGGSQVFEINTMMFLWIIGIIVCVILCAMLILYLSRYFKNKLNIQLILTVLLGIYITAQISAIYFLLNNNMRYLSYTFKIPYFMNLSWANYFYTKNNVILKLKSIAHHQSRIHYPLHLLQYHPPKHPLNVLVIMLDSLRYDMLNSKNMPNVNQFANQHTRFLDNFSGGDCTRTGIFSFFYGIPATYWKSTLIHHQPSIIIQAFAQNHYDLKILTSASLYTPPFYQNVFASVKNLQMMAKGNTAIDRDKTVTTEMRDFLKTESKSHHPFFGFIFYDAPHAYNAEILNHPFQPTEFLNYFHVNKNIDRTPIFNLYQNAVFEDDRLVGKLFSTIKKLNLLKNTIIIFTSDHGQEFNDLHNNYWEHASGFSKYQIRVPLIIAMPNQKPSLITYKTTHFDAAPTLLKRVLGVRNTEHDYSIGDDFFSTSQPDFIISGNYAYYALISKNHIMIFHDSGLYRFTNLKMQSQSQIQFNAAIENKAIFAMTRFF